MVGHESIQRAMARLDPARREEEQSANTSQHTTARLDPARKEEKNDDTPGGRNQG